MIYCNLAYVTPLMFFENDIQNFPNIKDMK